MSLFRDSDEDEIRRLRGIVEKLERVRQVQVVSVEMEPKPGYGYVFYITAPTMASEEDFGLALIKAIQAGFRKIDVDSKADVIGGDHIAPRRVGGRGEMQ
jgi:hypothetical protein